ncbi:MAG: DNA-directed DNA polymerase II large subunit [Candidatus Odinarchaeota archaeon]
MSKTMELYFNRIQKQVDKCYLIAERARQKGLDPELEVESPQAKDLAGRVEKLVGPKGVAEVIRELKRKGLVEDELIFKVVTDILDRKIGNIDALEARVDRAIRVGLAIKTMGVVSAPLEGISKILIREDTFGKKYLSLYFAGPIRAAGGTTTALCVLIADYVRKKSNLPRYEATDGEIGRYVEEVKLYDRRVHLQYPSSTKEIRYAVSNLPVEINGDSTEDEEVSAFRDLPRIETNKIRGGACLVLNDGILLKAPKLLKIAKAMNLEGWDWLADLKKIAQHQEPKEKRKQNEERTELKITPNSKYIADIIAGRPVFSHPSKVGGHRIRYGRSRNTGLAAGGMHPATMALLDDFVAIGTQLRIERPGKSSSICPVNNIAGPIVKLKNGNVINISSVKKAKTFFSEIEEILFLGDLLFGYGEFTENNHILIPSGYVEEWWALELENSLKNEGDIDERLKSFIKNPFKVIPTAQEAVQISKKYYIPLHPFYLDFWGNLTVAELITLRTEFIKKFSESEQLIVLKNEESIKKILEKAFIPHKIKNSKIVFNKSMNFIYKTIFNLNDKKSKEIESEDNVFSYFNKISSIKIKNKAPYFMGSRMGRPEKSEKKSMKGIHALFPLSDAVGSTRLFEKAMEYNGKKKNEIKLESKKGKSFNIGNKENVAKLGKVRIDVCRKKCPNCGKSTIFNICPNCETHTELQKICSKCKILYPTYEFHCQKCNSNLKTSYERIFNIKEQINQVLENLNVKLPDKLKGIIGLTNEYKVPEPIEKGILRAKNEVLVYKTAEIRYDATDIPLTHFKPKEIGASIDTLKTLGYDKDIEGNLLKDDNQILELKVQDIILSDDCAEYFIKIAKFLDDELELFYHMEPFYNVSDRNDLIGHLVVGLAPHTSAGIIGRIIGFTPARSIYAHPFWHAAKRRNCFPGETTVLVDIEGKITKVSLQKLYEDYFDKEFFNKTAFFKKNAIKSILIYAYDKISGGILPTKITNVVKIPFASRYIRFELITGRSFKTTLEHPILVFSNGELIQKKAIEVLENDLFLLPCLDFEIVDIEQFDLLEEFLHEKFKAIWNDLMVRGLKTFVKELIMINGLKETAFKLKLNKKTLNNYYSVRDSIPFDILINLLKMHNLTIKEVPDCSLGFKQDHTRVQRFIKVDENLMKLFGYYIAEGFYRQIPEGYQIDLAVSESDIRNDMKNAIKNSFGDGFKPYINNNRITISNRVLFHFFKDIIEFKNKARKKHIPNFLFKLPLEKVKFLLAAYFSGDGGLDMNHKIISCSSFSIRFIQDVDLMLLRYGIFSAISKSIKDENIEYKIRIRGTNVIKFKEKIDFISIRKKKSLDQIIKSKKTKPEKLYQNHRLIKIKKIEIIESTDNFIYSLEAANYHTVIVNENIITHQCDGDEDGVMLLLDPLLNFSRHYLPSKIGGRMDATLVVGTKIDPNEIDIEAHNIDTLQKYPLEFYKATERYCSPSEIEKLMKLVKSHLGTPNQYENIWYNIPTDNINEGPITSAYKTYETMDDKIDAQLHLARIIKAVDAKNVAEKILTTHFNPDILGNLRKFSVQKFRCVKCNEKYRRPPISNGGKCAKCGNRVILTVNRGGIEKYIPRAIDLCNNFNLDDYTKQRMELIEEYVESLTNNPKLKQHKLSDFF